MHQFKKNKIIKSCRESTMYNQMSVNQKEGKNSCYLTLETDKKMIEMKDLTATIK